MDFWRDQKKTEEFKCLMSRVCAIKRIEDISSLKRLKRTNENKILKRFILQTRLRIDESRMEEN